MKLGWMCNANFYYISAPLKIAPEVFQKPNDFINEPTRITTTTNNNNRNGANNDNNNDDNRGNDGKG